MSVKPDAQRAALRAAPRRLFGFGRTTWARFARHHMPTHAAALAYRGALALFPFLLLVFALLHAAGLEDVARALVTRATEGGGADRGALGRWIGTQIEQPPDGGLLSIGALTAAWAVATGIRGLRLALAIAGDGSLDPAAVPFWRRVALSLGIVPLALVATIAAAISLLATEHAIETVGLWLGGGFALAQLFTWLRIPVALMLVTLLLVGAYHLTPGRRQSLRAVLPGAALAALSWTVMSLGFSVALSTVLDYGATYGSFGAAITLLVYLHLSAAVVLAGAEVNAVRWEKAHGSSIASGGSDLHAPS